MSRADLHLHTFYSDGTFAPEEVIKRARELGIGTLSITDHDSVEGIARARAAAAGAALEIIPGVEMTTAFQGRELHILGYGLRVEDASFTDFLAQLRGAREGRIQAMIERLNARGIPVTFEQVKAAAGQGAIGRPHLAEVLMNLKAVHSIEAAFQRYIGDDGPCFVKTAVLTVPEAVQRIAAAGGVAVLAHPHRIVEDQWLEELVRSGIEGIEAYHSEQQSPAVVQKYQAMAWKHKLLVTGGSDCHGFRKSRGPLIGSVTIPDELVLNLREAIRRKN